MGVALPELPDDRRAQSRRADAGPRHSRDIPVGRHAAPAPDGLPGRPWTVDEGYGRRGLPGEPDPRNGGHDPAGWEPPPVNGHARRDDDRGPGPYPALPGLPARDSGHRPAPDGLARNGGPRPSSAGRPGFDPPARDGGRGLDEPTGPLPGGSSVDPSSGFHPPAGDGGRGLDEPTGLWPGENGVGPASGRHGNRNRLPERLDDRPGPVPYRPQGRPAIRADEIAGYGPGSYGDPGARPVDDRRQARYPDEPASPPAGVRRNGHPGPRAVEGDRLPADARPPADDDTVAIPAVPPAPPPARAPESDVPPPRRSATGPVSRSVFLQKPVQRPAADEDPPTVALRGDPADDVPDDDAVPGRHRRRAGESASGRPAADYRAEAAAAGLPTRGGRRRRPAFWKELPILIVVALLLTVIIQTFVSKVYVIPSGSMETTLHGCTGCTNDRVLVDKITYKFSDPRPGDVIVFRGPDGWTSDFTADPPSNVVVAALQQLGSLVGLAPPDEKDFIKRVIAVGGQTVQCCDSRNRVLVDGKPLDEPYIYYLPEAGPARQDSFGPVTVPQGYLWVMGDSRNNSADSRVAGHGAIPIKGDEQHGGGGVIGKARLIVLPFARFGSIPDPNPQGTAVGMGGDAGAPLALGLVGVLPLVALRRRRGRDGFLPGD